MDDPLLEKHNTELDLSADRQHMKDFESKWKQKGNRNKDMMN